MGGRWRLWKYGEVFLEEVMLGLRLREQRGMWGGSAEEEACVQRTEEGGKGQRREGKEPPAAGIHSTQCGRGGGPLNFTVRSLGV
jgi:hypothetical protein